MLSSFLLLVALQASPPAVCFLPEEPCLEELLTSLRAATDSVDVAMYKFTHEKVAVELAKAADDGKKVRILLDADEAKKKTIEKLGDKSLVRTLASKDDLHHKFMLIDGKLLITGSVNYNKNLECCNEENLLFLTDPGLVRRFGEKFEMLFRRGKSEDRFSE